MSGALNNTSYYTVALLLIAAVITAVYWQGLNGPFIYDDWQNITSNENVKITNLSVDNLRRAMSSGEAGPLGRPIAMLSFALNHAFSGMSEKPFKITNLAIHIANTVLVFFFARLLIGHWTKGELSNRTLSFIALISAAWWALSPMNVTAVLYTVQRMTSLSTLFMLCGIVLYLAGRVRNTESKAHGHTLSVLGVLIFTPLAVLTKETGILIFCFLAVIEFYVISPQKNSPSLKNLRLPLLITICGTLAFFYFLSTNWSAFSAKAELNGFTIHERILTEARVLWWYLRMLLIPNATDFGLVHDYWDISKTLIAPISTLFACAGIIILLALCAATVGKSSPLAFGLGWFLAGHVLESTVFPLLLVFEHRNYAPSIGLFVGLSLCLHKLIFGLQLDDAEKQRIFMLAALGIVLVNAGVTYTRSLEWKSIDDLAQSHALRHPESANNQFILAARYATIAQHSQDPLSRLQYLLSAEEHFDLALENDPGMAGAAIAKVVMYSAVGNPPPEEAVERVVTALNHGRLVPGTRNAIGDITTCAEDPACVMPEQVVRRVFEAALKHPDARGQIRSDILANFSHYLGAVLGEYETALAIAKNATAQPEARASTHLLVARWLTALNRLDDAREELRTLGRLDARGTWKTTIEDWQNQLDRLQSEQSEILQPIP